MHYDLRLSVPFHDGMKAWIVTHRVKTRIGCQPLDRPPAGLRRIRVELGDDGLDVAERSKHLRDHLGVKNGAEHAVRRRR